MIGIAWQNLVHDRMRLAVSLVGVAVAATLMLAQAGIYRGFLNSVSAVIDHCPADVWVVAAKTTNSMTAEPISEGEYVRVKGTPGIEWAEKLAYALGDLRLPDGAGMRALITAFNPNTGRGGPWEMVQGTTADLNKQGTYIVDESALNQLQGLRIGDTLENLGHRMEIVGICRGARSYSTYPVMFTSFRTLQEHTAGLRDRLTFVAAKIDPAADREVVMERLRGLSNLEAHTKVEFSGLNRNYFARKTGIGIGISVTIVLGFIVGVVIVGQTMYASTVERLREYATLKALGMTNAALCGMIWLQALAVGCVGYALGAGLALAGQAILSRQTMSIEIDMPPSLFATMFGAAMFMCFSASLLSVVRVLRVDPATVYRA